MFERSEYWPRDRSSEIVLGLESAEGNAPSAEDTIKMHGGKGENGGKPERPWMVGMVRRQCSAEGATYVSPG